MAHLGGLNVLKTSKETLISYFFNIGGLLAGFLVASQLGLFQKAPWILALYPTVIGAKGVLEGILSGRLSTALHLGTARPQFLGNTKSFYKLVEAVIVLTFITSLTMGIISLLFSHFLWEVNLADLAAVPSVAVATMTLGLALILATLKVAFITFKKGADPDIVIYPVMSAIATVFITLCYLATLNLFFSHPTTGKIITILIGAIHLVAVLFIISRNVHTKEFTKTIREALAALIIVAFIVNVTGTLLKGIGNYVRTNTEILTIYPAIIGLVSNVGSVVGSTATTKLALGILKPKLSAIKNHIPIIFGAWLPSVVISVLLAIITSLLHGTSSLAGFYNLSSILLTANVIAMFMIVLLSYSISVVTFQRGLDPDNFVIPIETSFAASITSTALLAAVVLIGTA
ncbi:MAG: magnesium transporter [Candidatus Bathyarchaeota archaeon]|nr:magnesium transporter [Candidatus Bathyarchaeota archaeon]